MMDKSDLRLALGVVLASVGVLWGALLIGLAAAIVRHVGGF